MNTSDHDKLLSGRVKARFGVEAIRHAARALAAGNEYVLNTVPDEQLEDAMNGFRLLRALRRELEELASQERQARAFAPLELPDQD